MKLASLIRLPCFELFFLDSTSGRLLIMGVVSLHPGGQVNGKCPSAEVFQVLLPNVATRRQHFSMRYLIPFLVSAGVQ